jgi:hypothetical protein
MQIINKKSVEYRYNTENSEISYHSELVKKHNSTEKKVKQSRYRPRVAQRVPGN